MRTLRFPGPGRHVYEVVRVSETPPKLLNGERVPAGLARAIVWNSRAQLGAAFDFTACCRAWGVDPDLDRFSEQLLYELSLGEAGQFALRELETPWPALDAQDPGSIPRLADVGDDPAPAPDPIVEPPTTVFEVRYVDELGEPLSDVPLRLSAGDATQLTTDAQGTARLDDAQVSFATAQVTSHAALREQLRERWAQARGQEWFEPPDPATSTVQRYAEPLPTIGLESKTLHTVVIQPGITRARIVGAAFDTNKAFLLPAALPRIQSVVELYDTHAGAEMLVIGHTDTSGQPSVNDPLSLQRAASVTAYLTDDVDAWLDWYENHVSASRRWGAHEDHAMLDAVLVRRGEIAQGDPVEHFQASRGLQVDGDIGPETRRQLVTEYMALDGTTLPSDITPIPHGAGENFPLADDGVELDVDPVDGQDDPTDRRVEVLFFDAPFGVLPPAPGDNSPPGGAEYREWLLRVRQTDDFIVDRQHALAVRVTDQHTGENIVGATVVLAPAKGLGAGADAAGGGALPTDAFGVSAFIDLGPGAYTLTVFKDGFEAFAGAHVLEAEDAPTVIPVELRATIPLDIRLRLSDPRGDEIPFPADVPVTIAFEDGGELDATTDADGVASFVTDRRDGRFTTRIDLGTENYFVVPVAKGQPTQRADRATALAAAGHTHRFVRVPAQSEASTPTNWVLEPLEFDEDRFISVQDTAKRSREGQGIGLHLVPRWQVLQFEYFDRFHRKRATVPGPSAKGQPAPVLSGHLSRDTSTGPPTDIVAESAWSLRSGTEDVHCVAWFPEGTRRLPDATSMVRLVTPPRTFVVSGKSPGRGELEQVPPSGQRFDLATQPSAERLRFYDLPADWRSHRYFVRSRDTLPKDKQPYPQLVNDPTSIAVPLVVSLDDIAIVRISSTGSVVAESIARGDEVGDQIAILDDRLRVYRPNTTRPAGIGEPYFTDRTALQPSSETDSRVVPHVLLDYPPFTRAVVFKRVHDVFDQRCPPGAIGLPIGARLAVRTAASTDPSPSPAFFETVRYKTEWPRNEPAHPTHKTYTNGRSSIAVFRCCGRHLDGVERFAVLRRTRVHFDFAPTDPPPAGARKLDPNKNEVPSAADQIMFTSQALLASASRWNGDDGNLPKMRSILRPKAKPVQPPEVSKHAVEIEVGNPVVARGSHVVLFQRGEQKNSHDNILVELYQGVRASMPGSGKTQWEPGDLEMLPDPKDKDPSHAYTTAHELGHALGLPDEYNETSKHASMFASSISDRLRSRGAPYSPDEGSMMRGNIEPRNRHFWSVVPWLVDEAKMFPTQRMTVVRGDFRYRVPVTTQTRTPSYFPVARTPFRAGAPIGKKGLCDVFMYRTGADAYTGDGLRGSSPKKPYDALIVARLKIALSFTNRNVDFMHRVALAVEQTMRAMGGTVGAEAECRLDREELRARVVIVPRVIVTSFPSFQQSPGREDRIDDYLSDLSYDGKTVPSQAKVGAAQKAIEDLELGKLNKKLNKADTKLVAAKHKRATAKQALTSAEAKRAAAEAKHEAAKQRLAAAHQAIFDALPGPPTPAQKAELDAARQAELDAHVALFEAQDAIEPREKDLAEADDELAAAQAERNAAAAALAKAQKEETKLEQDIKELRTDLPSEYADFVEHVIEQEKVHCRVHVTDKGVTRLLDADAKPRTGLLVLDDQMDLEVVVNPIDPVAAFRIKRLFGKLLGLRTPGGIPPPAEYRPLTEALVPRKGKLVIDKLRRPK